MNLDRMPMPQKGRHPIVFLDYVPRFIGQLFVSIIVVTVLISQQKATGLTYFLALFTGLIWPHITLYLSLRSKNPKPLELKFLFLDSFFVGCWIAYIDFALWPSVLFVSATFMASLSVHGIKLGIQSLVANLLGAITVMIFYGFHFSPDTDVLTTALCIFSFMLFPGVMGYMTYFRAQVAKETKVKLRVAYKELDQINKILHEASSSLELDNVMKIVIHRLHEVFKFDFATVQIADEEANVLYFKSIYGETINDIAREEICNYRIKFSDECLSTKVYFKNKELAIAEITDVASLPKIDQEIQSMVWYASLILFPITIKQKAIGVIGFYGRSKMTIDQTIINRINYYLSQVSLIINNAMLYEQVTNKQLEINSKNTQLAALSDQLSKYLSPQLVGRIMKEERNVEVGADRKRLTIFFSDVVGFTQLSDRIESEELTAILNNYLDQMTTIALKYGGTIDKYIGDAIMIFFGDPESQGIKNDAINCAKMSIEMRDKIRSLVAQWEDAGIAENLQVRMGINTGYCAVGNFGSDYRMDYTVIGSNVNLASRLQTTALPGEIVISSETYLLIKSEIECEKADVITVKGISHPIQTYKIIDYRKKPAPQDEPAENA